MNNLNQKEEKLKLNNKLKILNVTNVGNIYIKIRKKFASAKTLDQHTQTKKHNPNVAKTEQSTTKAPKPKAQFKKNSK